MVGLLRLRLHIPEARSLKDRRAVVRRAVDRVRARYKVSVAEVGDLAQWQSATLGVSMVTNDRAYANEVLDKIVSTVASTVAGVALLTHREMDLVTYGDDEPLGDDNLLGPEE